MYSILLLGGTGTLSTAVLNCSIEYGYMVSIMNRGYNNINIPNNVEIIICDFTNTNDLISKFSDRYFDVVVDFLSRVPSDISRVYPVFADHCKQYIFISSACVYRRAMGDFPIKEDSPKPNIDWDYNVEKHECEKMLISLAKKSKSCYSIVRPYITYNDERIPFGIAPSYKLHKTIIERFRAGKPWFTWDDGTAITTVTYVEDFALAVVGLFLNKYAENEDFHVTSDYCYTQKELIEITKNAMGSVNEVVNLSTEQIGKLLPEYKSMLIGDRSLDAKFDNTKIKKAIPNLKFRTSYHEGIKNILNYWQSQKPNYDYIFEARIDKMLSKVGVHSSYVKYPGAENKTRCIYLIYRYLPLRIASKISRWI